MIQLHQFRPFWGLPNASPFCMKAETYLRWAKLEYEAIASDPGRSPYGQIPFVVTEGLTIADSQKIIEHFESRTGHQLDQSLSAQQRAQAWFIRTRVEDTLYWQITYMRWGDPKGWKVFLPDLKPNLSGWKKYGLPITIRFILRIKMRARGMTSSDAQKSYARGFTMLNELSQLLGEQAFFQGDQIRSLDMSLYAFLANIIDQPYPNLLQDHARDLDNLQQYCKRMKTLIWSSSSRAA